MYIYNKYDNLIIKDRIRQYKNQMKRYLLNEISEDEFRILRLQNGLYMQRYSYMLRIAVPYGLISNIQMKKIAYIVNKYDKNLCHITTRQNIQLNWINLKNSYYVLKELSKVSMHAIQTSGNCIRNITSDEFSGVAIDEIVDPRPYAEIIREWSTLHPEFSYLPRKFKIAISGSKKDRVVVGIHDIGIKIIKRINGEIGFTIFLGGGLGRIPIIGKIICRFLPYKYLLSYLECILRVYNLYGRRNNLYKSRIKILLKSIGYKNFIIAIKKEWLNIKNNYLILSKKEILRISKHFKKKKYKNIKKKKYLNLLKIKKKNFYFRQWYKNNLKKHKVPGYVSLIISLKRINYSPGDISYNELNVISDLSKKYSFSEIRISHKQNIILADVEKKNVYKIWKILKKYNLVNFNNNLLTDIICCPGGDFCSLANARSISIFKIIYRKFNNFKFQNKIGKIKINISGCINSCGHHHIGNIGILGVDKKQNEYYQILLGGNSNENINIGNIIGPAFNIFELPKAINLILKYYLNLRINKYELFLNFVKRIGINPFKNFIYLNLNKFNV